MQSIITRDLPATNTRGRRIVAECVSKKMVFAYDTMDGSYEENHLSAATLLVKELGWGHYGTWHGGQLSTGNWAWVCDNESNPAFDLRT